MERKQPLIDYLGRKNPKLVTERLKCGSNSKSRGKEWISPGYISEWEEFRFEILASIYDGALLRVLQEVFPCNDYSYIPQKPFRELVDEDSIEVVLMKWTQSTVTEALSMAQNCLYQSEPQNVIYMARGGQAYCQDFVPQTRRVRLGPDWAGIQPGSIDPSKHALPKNILPGDTKVSRKWKSKDIERGCVDEEYLSGDWIQPISQVSTYCIKADARYGYIITDEELVVLRISQMTEDELAAWIANNGKSEDVAPPQGDSQATDASFNSADHAKSNEREKSKAIKPAAKQKEEKIEFLLEYKAIKWTDARRPGDPRSSDLTVNLALWWLHIMASVDTHIGDKYQSLREVAKPTCFTNQSSSFVLSETSENSRSKLPIRHRKRSVSGLSDESFSSDGFGEAYPVDSGRSMRSTKRVRTGDKDNQNKRQTRSMASSRS